MNNLNALQKIRRTLEHYYDTVDVQFIKGTNKESYWIVKDEGQYIDIYVIARYGKITRVTHI
jgi:hypothetical protein